MKRILAVNSNCYHGYSIEDAIAGIQAAGFHFIELTATKGWTEHVFPNLSFERLLTIQDELQKASLTPFAMSGHCNLMDTARIGDFEKNIRLAAFFGCKYIVSSVGEAHLKDQATADNAQVAEHIAALVPMLEKHGLTLVLETHGKEHGTGKALSAIVKLVNSPRVKVNYDTGNVIFYGDANPCQDLAACIADVGYMHLKDKTGEKTAWDFPALGKGYVDFPKLFQMMDQADNASPYSIEIEFTQAGPKNLEEINRAVMDSAAYLRGLGYTL